MKKCTRCLKVKPLSEFGYRNRKTKEGVKPSILSYCKQCNAEYSRKRYMEMRTNNLKCVYRFLNFDEEVIYVGKTERIEYRINSHISKNSHLPMKCYEEIYKIQFMTLSSTVLMDIKEMYYINLYKPKYNSDHLYNEEAFIISDFSKDKWLDYSKEIVNKMATNKKNDVADTSLFNLDNVNYNIRTIFCRKRNDRYIVYVEYKDGNGRIKQINKGAFDNKKEANNLVKELKLLHNKK